MIGRYGEEWLVRGGTSSRLVKRTRRDETRLVSQCSVVGPEQTKTIQDETRQGKSSQYKAFFFSFLVSFFLVNSLFLM